MHENLQRNNQIAGPSNRNFGLTFAVVFGILAAITSYRGSSWAVAWSSLSGVVLTLTWLAPQLLSPLNWAWLKLGLLLHRVTNPILMGIMFYFVIFPIGLLLRIFGKDLLRLKREPSSDTYWIIRTDGRSPSTAMREQF